MNTITSLYDLRQTLAAALAAALPDVEVLPALPTTRCPVPEDKTLLVIGVQSLSRAASLLDPADGIVIETGLRLTVFHRTAREECERVTGALAALSLAGGFPFPVLSLASRAAEYSRTLGSFSQATDCTLTCLLAEAPGEEAAP